MILGEESKPQRDAASMLSAWFPGLRSALKPSELLDGIPPLAYVALGPTALEAACRVGLDAPLVSMWTFRQTYERLLAQSTASDGTAIYAEPSPDQQMRLIAALYRRRITVGVFLSIESAPVVPLLQQASKEHNIDLVLAQLDAGASLTRALAKLAIASVLLIVPDSNLYTPASLRELLDSTYRKRMPVVGFSASLVRAGTLCSAHSDLFDSLAQLRLVLAAIQRGHVPAPSYPLYWRVAFNDSVARSLDVIVEDSVRGMGHSP